MLSPEETQRIERKLDLNERLVWCGKPRPKGLNKHTIGAMLFGIPWTAISGTVSGMFLVSMWLKPNDSPLLARLGFTLFFIPFWCISVAMLGAPLWLRLRQKKWLYAVTDKSVLIVGAFRTTRLRRHNLFSPDRADHRNGLSDILFATSDYAVNGRHLPIGFVNLPTAEANAAEQAVRDLTDSEDE